jgi:hypothetical protein
VEAASVTGDSGAEGPGVAHPLEVEEAPREVVEDFLHETDPHLEAMDPPEAEEAMVIGGLVFPEVGAGAHLCLDLMGNFHCFFIFLFRLKKKKKI